MNPRPIASLVALVFAAACSSSSSPSTSGKDGGSASSSSGASSNSSQSSSRNLETNYTTTCSPDLDLGKGTVVTAAATVAPTACYLGMPTPAVTVVDSDAALRALFTTDAGAECASIPFPTGVDYTSDRVAVFAAGGISAASLTVYQVGSETVFDASENKFGAMAEPLVYMVTLPVALSTSTELTICTTSCSGACPG